MAQKHTKKSPQPLNGFSCKTTGLDCSPFCDKPQFLKILFSYISDEMAIIDAQGRFICLNDAAVAGLSYSRAYIFKKRVVDFFNEKMSVRKWKAKYFDEIKRQGVPMSYRLELVSKDGEVRMLDVTAAYVKFDGRDLLFSFGRDITRQMQLQRSLQDSKNLYRFLTEGAGDGIVAIDIEGRLTYVNQRMQDFMGFTPGQFLGKHFSTFVSEASSAKSREIFDSVRAGKQRVNETVEIRTMTGNMIPFEMNVTPLIKSGKVVSIYVIARDLRSRRHAEQMARQSEKMDALRYFVAGTAQELKNPLLGVSKRVQVLLDKYAQRDFEYISYREFKDIFSNIEAIKEQLHYCYETSQRLMDMGQKKAGIQKNFCHLSQIVKDVIQDRKSYMQQQDVKIRLNLSKKDLCVRMSVVDLTQVLHNLVDNAIQAMPSGGRIRVKTALDPRRDEVLLEVSDQGVGIPPDQLDHIFEPFFTTKPRGLRKNSGLGLPIVHALVSECQGNMVVQSSLRKGTTVKVFLPIYQLKHTKI